MSAGRGLLQATLSWNPQEVVPTLTGSARISLAGGSVRRSAAPGESFPLWIVFSPLGAAQSGSMSFDRLEGEFDLREGNAYTSDLHLDGDVEVIVRGRTGLLARDYDHTAWILRGEERLPVAIRRFGAAPAVASVWLGVRDFFAAGSPRRTLHVGGSWADPVVTTQTSER